MRKRASPRSRRRRPDQLAIQQAAWAKISKNAAAVKRALALDAEAQRELAARIASLLERQRQFGNIPSVFNGTLIWPMSGVITQEFGCTGFPSEPPLGNCAHFHQGIDIAAPMYTPIHAAGDGVVLFVGSNPYDPYPKAWIVIIAHSDNLRHLVRPRGQRRPPTGRVRRATRDRGPGDRATSG